MREVDKQILADHYLDLYQMAYSMLQNKADAEDAVQEALVVTMTRQLWGDPCRYCTAVLRNICRKMKKSNVMLIDYMFDIPNPVGNTDSLRLHRLMDLLDAMPKHTKEILLLHYEKGYSKTEIAEMKNVSLSTVKKIFKKGQEQLKQQLIEMEKNDKDIFKP